MRARTVAWCFVSVMLWMMGARHLAAILLLIALVDSRLRYD